MEELMEKLSEHGRVITCKQVHEDVVTVLMTNEFNGNLAVSMEIGSAITESFPDHPVLESMVIDDDVYLMVLTRKQQ